MTPSGRPATPPTRTALRTAGQVYDVIVVGSQLGGAIAGALLARRGHRVLLVDHDGVHDRYEDGGFLLPYGPSLLPPLRELPAAKAVLEELGLLAEVGRELGPHAPLQVLLPGARVELAAEPEARLAELRRAFGPSGAELHARIERAAARHGPAGLLLGQAPLPAHGLGERFARWRLARRSADALAEADALPPDHPLTAALAGLAAFASHLDAPLPAWAFGRTVSPLLAGALRFPGGREGLVGLLRNAVARQGGDRLGARERAVVADQLLLDGGRFAGVRLQGYGAPFRARFCVWASEVGALLRLTPPSRTERRLGELARRVRPGKLLFALNLVLRASGLPPGLGGLALLARPTGPVLIELAPTRDASDHPVPGLVTVSAAGVVDPSVRTRGEEGLRAATADLRAALEEVLPFHARHLVRESAPYLLPGAQTAASLPHALVASLEARPLGVEALPPIGPIGRLVFASREVLPGLGLEGEWLAGLRAAELADQAIRKVDPLA